MSVHDGEEDDRTASENNTKSEGNQESYEIQVNLRHSSKAAQKARGRTIAYGGAEYDIDAEAGAIRADIDSHEEMIVPVDTVRRERRGISQGIVKRLRNSEMADRPRFMDSS